MYETIKFKPFEFPSWGCVFLEDYYAITLSNEAYMSLSVDMNHVLAAFYGRGSKKLPHTQQGYTDACKWLNDQKYELYRKAGE